MPKVSSHLVRGAGVWVYLALAPKTAGRPAVFLVFWIIEFHRSSDLMIDEQELLNAIWSSPHDDALRLIYADFLQDKGDELSNARAAFIRVQCQLANDATLSKDHRCELQSIELNLWKRFGRQFQKGLTGKLLNEPFHRGFIAPRRRPIAISHFFNLAEQLIKSAPLWEFRFHDAPNSRVLELVNHFRMECLGFIGLNRLDDEIAVAIANSTHFKNLFEIHCESGAMTSVGLLALCYAKGLPHLTSLSVGFQRTVFDLPLANALIESPLAVRLKRLDLSRCETITTPVAIRLKSHFSDRVVIAKHLMSMYPW